jgi:hypothetical protein
MLISAKRVTVIIDTKGLEPPFISQFDYFFPTPINEIKIKKFLHANIKKLRYSIKEIKFGPERKVSKNRIWPLRKIQEDILAS